MRSPTLGTATTSTHVRKLLRQASQVVFCFDGDNAGRKAAWRALEASLDVLADDKLVGFIFLPVEHDPDSFVRAEGAEAFRLPCPTDDADGFSRVILNRARTSRTPKDAPALSMRPSLI